MRRHSPLRQALAGSAVERASTHRRTRRRRFAMPRAPRFPRVISRVSPRQFSRYPAPVGWRAPVRVIFPRKIPLLQTVGRCDALPEPRIFLAGVRRRHRKQVVPRVRPCCGDCRFSGLRTPEKAGGTSEPIGRFPPDREPPAGVLVRRLGRFEHAPPAMFLALRPCIRPAGPAPITRGPSRALPARVVRWRAAGCRRTPSR